MNIMLLNSIAKKGNGIIDSRILMSNVPKNVINNSFEDYRESLSNGLYKLRVV